MAIPYLNGGERATVARMNALFTAPDVSLDAKLAKLLSGKSFFLAQSTQMPANLVGKAFFFTSGVALYANRVPGFVDTGLAAGVTASGIARPYDHSQFTAAVAAIDQENNVTWDETHKIAVCEFAYAELGGLPGGLLLDWSLDAHFLMHQGASDTEPVPYYIRPGSYHPPEKKHRFTLAEIIIEGPTAVTLPAGANKHECYRLHNLNCEQATCTMPDGLSVTLAAYECATVRNGTVRHGSYFFAFEPGDPRFYWFMPSADTSPRTIGDGYAVSDSMGANNLSNPAILLDWVEYLTREPYSGAEFYHAGWAQDASVQCDVSAFYSDLFGDPSDPATRLGDLLHHKGDLLLIKESKTQTDPATGYALLTFDTLRFNGYATIVADFAAKNITVAPNGSGNYVLTGNDPDNYLYLVPISTNLLKAGETIPTIVNLRLGSRTIESAVLENPSYDTLSTSGPELIQSPTLVTSVEQTYWVDNGTTTYVDSDPIPALQWPARGSAITINGVQNVTVANVLSLDLWGNPSNPGQVNQYCTCSDRQLKLTPHGLVLTYTEEHALIRTATGGWPTVLGPTKRVIRFRGHGWGFIGADGSRSSGWLSPRKGRFQVGEAFTDEVYGTSGADFGVQRLNAVESSVKVLSRVKTADLSLPSNYHRFWRTRQPGDYIVGLLEHLNTLSDAEFRAMWWQHYRNANPGYAGIQPALPHIAMALLPEMYNALARAVNAVTAGFPLSYETLRWVVNGKRRGLCAYKDLMRWWAIEDYGEMAIPGYVPMPYVPADCFMMFQAGSEFEALCTTAGIPVLDTSDFPGGKDRDSGTDQEYPFFTQQRLAPAVCVTRFQVSASGAAVSDVYDAETQTGESRLSCNLSVVGTIEMLEMKRILAGEATGTLCVGTYDPANPGSVSNGQFKVANDGSGGLLLPSGIVYLPLIAAGAYVKADGGKGTWPDPDTMRWCKISDVKAVVESFGLNFAYCELTTPLSLEYFCDNVTPSVSTRSGSEAFDSGVLTHGQTMPEGGTWVAGAQMGNTAAVEANLNASTADSMAAVYDSTGEWNYNGLNAPRLWGSLVKFCVTDDLTSALWKSAQGWTVQGGLIGSVVRLPEAGSVISSNGAGLVWYSGGQNHSLVAAPFVTFGSLAQADVAVSVVPDFDNLMQHLLTTAGGRTGNPRRASALFLMDYSDNVDPATVEVTLCQCGMWDLVQDWDVDQWRRLENAPFIGSGLYWPPRWIASEQQRRTISASTVITRGNSDGSDSISYYLVWRVAGAFNVVTPAVAL